MDVGDRALAGERAEDEVTCRRSTKGEAAEAFGDEERTGMTY